MWLYDYWPGQNRFLLNRWVTGPTHEVWINVMTWVLLIGIFVVNLYYVVPEIWPTYPYLVLLTSSLPLHRPLSLLW